MKNDKDARYLHGSIQMLVPTQQWEQYIMNPLINCRMMELWLIAQIVTCFSSLSTKILTREKLPKNPKSIAIVQIHS